ncbi:hypothetical protein SNN68_003936 [Cronobacter sakazakii]|uniref:hypothetical protein n=1 Tax=Cronobacter sakazakii TaxID=28141 RepID=UPI0006D1A5F8|nr:hypothetical protein [Cronobacter sakazakii]EIZ9495570.1 hypothetical protein [Cronobacter sakazakii]EJA3065662.1 hypothetical protein [Cronobacter sakazakii]EJA3082784.1 hypothetical protein [Cronobacter sakazakii]EJA3123213.1 hypothetical protein [Cronobacter sakazakii]EJC8204118.1 hypothetical protein [Cronobacter sakazakii]
MSLLERLKNPEKYKDTSKKKPPLETDFSNGEESDAWFVAWEVFHLNLQYPHGRILQSVGSDIFTFPKNMAPKDILQDVKISLSKHLGLKDISSMELEDGMLIKKIVPSSNLHITQFQKV